MNILSLTFSNSKNVAAVKGTTFRQAAPNNYNEIPAHDEFVRSTGSLDIARLKNLGISHFRLIDSNSVRGVTLANQAPILLTELKECGINTIIDLRPEGSDDSKYAQNCKKNGLDYFNLKIRDNIPIFNAPFSGKMTAEERRASIEKFVNQLGDFFKLLDNGKNYMACLLGLHRTDLAVTMNYLLNPKEPTTPPTLSHMFFPQETNLTNKYIGKVKNMLKNLTPKDREFLKMPDCFSDIFDARVLKLRLMNRAK